MTNPYISETIPTSESDSSMTKPFFSLAGPSRNRKKSSSGVLRAGLGLYFLTFIMRFLSMLYFCSACTIRYNGMLFFIKHIKKGVVRMKIGALAGSLRLPLYETFEAYSKLGLQGVQIGINPEFLEYSDDKLAEIKQKCKENNLTISAVCGDLGGHPFQIKGQHMERAKVLRHIVDIAVKLGTHVITTHIGVVPEDKQDPVYPYMVESIRYAADYAGEKGVTFAIETGPEKAETLLAFILEVNSKGLGVNLDPANLRMVSCEDPAHAVEVLGKYIVHTHAKDGINLFPGSAAAAYGVYNPDGTKRELNLEPAKFKEVPLGQGQVPWDSYLAALKKVGFNGFLTIERECGDDPAGDIKLAQKFLTEKLG